MSEAELKDPPGQRVVVVSRSWARRRKINKSGIEEHERLVRQLFSPLTMGEPRKPLARLSPDTARSVQPKPPQVLPA